MHFCLPAGCRRCCAPCPPCPPGPPVSSVTMFRRDADTGRALAGAHYTLTGNGRADRACSDAEGALTFCHLPAGSYQLSETQPPDGCLPEARSHCLAVQGDGTVLLDGLPAAGAALYGLPQEAAAPPVPGVSF